MKEDKKDTKKKDKKEEVGGKKGSTENKLGKLKKQYDKILTDLFAEHASCCIEEALDSSDSAFGADITAIVGTATDLLRGKVLADLGVNEPGGEDCDMMAAIVTPDGGGLELGGPMGADIDPGDEEDEESDVDVAAEAESETDED